MSRATLVYLFHHLFLPPKLPNGDDHSVEKEHLLLLCVLRGLVDFARNIDETYGVMARDACNMVENMTLARDDQGFIHERGLRKVLQQLAVPGTIVNASNMCFTR